MTAIDFVRTIQSRINSVILVKWYAAVSGLSDDPEPSSMSQILRVLRKHDSYDRPRFKFVSSLQAPISLVAISQEHLCHSSSYQSIDHGRLCLGSGMTRFQGSFRRSNSGFLSMVLYWRRHHSIFHHPRGGGLMVYTRTRVDTSAGSQGPLRGCAQYEAAK